MSGAEGGAEGGPVGGPEDGPADGPEGATEVVTAAAAGPLGSRGMRAAVFEGPGNIRIQHVPDPEVELATDAVVRVVAGRASAAPTSGPTGGTGSGSPARGSATSSSASSTDVGPDVRTVRGRRPGDLPLHLVRRDVRILPVRPDQTSCVDGGVFGEPGHDGAQGEALRVPHADGTLVVVPPALRDADPGLLLPLCDVLPTGHHAALVGRRQASATGSWSSGTARSGCARCWPPAGCGAETRRR